MKSFKTHTSEGTFTSGMIKSLGFMLRNKLSQKIKSGKASKDLSQKLDALLDAQGIIGSIGIMNIGMEDGGQSLMSRSIIIRGLINELHEEGIINQSEKEYLMIDKHQHHQNKVRNSLYFDQDTKRLIEEKSAELRLSQNKLTELCLQRYLPEMRMWN